AHRVELALVSDLPRVRGVMHGARCLVLVPGAGRTVGHLRGAAVLDVDVDEDRVFALVHDGHLPLADLFRAITSPLLRRRARARRPPRPRARHPPTTGATRREFQARAAPDAERRGTPRS